MAFKWLTTEYPTGSHYHHHKWITMNHYIMTNLWLVRPTAWRIIPVSKWLVTPMYKPFWPFGRGRLPYLGDLLTNWDEPPSRITIWTKSVGHIESTLLPLKSYQSRSENPPPKITKLLNVTFQSYIIAFVHRFFSGLKLVKLVSSRYIQLGGDTKMFHSISFHLDLHGHDAWKKWPKNMLPKWWVVYGDESSHWDPNP